MVQKAEFVIIQTCIASFYVIISNLSEQQRFASYFIFTFLADLLLRLLAVKKRTEYSTRWRYFSLRMHDLHIFQFYIKKETAN